MRAEDSQDHFHGKFEVEFKYRLACKASFLKTLADMPHEIMLEDNRESDWYFDTPRGDLGAQNKHLLIREMQPSGIKLWVVKGPGQDDCESSDISDVGAARRMLENMGYQLVQRACKLRSIYFIGPYHITLDYLEGLGHFAEFAIMTDDEASLAAHRHALRQLAASFHLDEQDLEPRSYRSLQNSLSQEA